MECEYCKYTLDTHSGIDHEEKPLPGDFSVCLNCGIISEFTESMNLYPLTDEKYLELKVKDPESFNMLDVSRIEIQNRGRIYNHYKDDS